MQMIIGRRACFVDAQESTEFERWISADQWEAVPAVEETFAAFTASGKGLGLVRERMEVSPISKGLWALGRWLPCCKRWARIRVYDRWVVREEGLLFQEIQRRILQWFDDQLKNVQWMAELRARLVGARTFEELAFWVGGIAFFDRWGPILEPFLVTTRDYRRVFVGYAMDDEVNEELFIEQYELEAYEEEQDEAEEPLFYAHSLFADRFLCLGYPADPAEKTRVKMSLAELIQQIVRAHPEDFRACGPSLTGDELLAVLFKQPYFKCWRYYASDEAETDSAEPSPQGA